MNETQTSHPEAGQAAADRIAQLEAALAAAEPVKTEADQAVGQELGAADELIDAQAERIRLLEEELAARDAAQAAADSYDLDEQFVPEGQGTCLLCSCEQYAVPRPKERMDAGDSPHICGPCGHPRSAHKRHPAGAQARP